MFGMSGWKTLTAGIGSIASGLGMLITGAMGCLNPEGACDGDMMSKGWAAIIFGWGLIGIGHKIDKSVKK